MLFRSNEIELLMDTAQKYHNMSDDQQMTAFQVLGEEQGGNLKASINNALMKANVTDEEFKRNVDMAKEKLSSSRAKEAADELETIFLDGSIPFIDKVKRAVEIVRQLPEDLRNECQPVLQVINSITRCPFSEQCIPNKQLSALGIEVGELELKQVQGHQQGQQRNQRAQSTLQGQRIEQGHQIEQGQQRNQRAQENEQGQGNLQGQRIEQGQQRNQRAQDNLQGQGIQQGQMGENVPKSGQEEGKLGQQQKLQQQPCFHLKLLKVCVIAKNKNE